MARHDEKNAKYRGPSQFRDTAKKSLVESLLKALSLTSLMSAGLLAYLESISPATYFSVYLIPALFAASILVAALAHLKYVRES